jgi:hypothetical protein
MLPDLHASPLGASQDLLHESQVEELGHGPRRWRLCGRGDDSRTREVGEEASLQDLAAHSKPTSGRSQGGITCICAGTAGGSLREDSSPDFLRRDRGLDTRTPDALEELANAGDHPRRDPVL